MLEEEAKHCHSKSEKTNKNINEETKVERK